MKDEKTKVKEWLREARQSLDRQRGGPMDRGDGSIIINALETFLRIVTPAKMLELYKIDEKETIERIGLCP